MYCVCCVRAGVSRAVRRADTALRAGGGAGGAARARAIEWARRRTDGGNDARTVADEKLSGTREDFSFVPSLLLSFRASFSFFSFSLCFAPPPSPPRDMGCATHANPRTHIRIHTSCADVRVRRCLRSVPRSCPTQHGSLPACPPARARVARRAPAPRLAHVRPQSVPATLPRRAATAAVLPWRVRGGRARADTSAPHVRIVCWTAAARPAAHRPRRLADARTRTRTRTRPPRSPARAPSSRRLAESSPRSRTSGLGVRRHDRPCARDGARFRPRHSNGAHFSRSPPDTDPADLARSIPRTPSPAHPPFGCRHRSRSRSRSRRFRLRTSAGRQRRRTPRNALVWPESSGPPRRRSGGRPNRIPRLSRARAAKQPGPTIPAGRSVRPFPAAQECALHAHAPDSGPLNSRRRLAHCGRSDESRRRRAPPARTGCGASSAASIGRPLARVAQPTRRGDRDSGIGNRRSERRPLVRIRQSQPHTCAANLSVCHSLSGCRRVDRCGGADERRTSIYRPNTLGTPSQETPPAVPSATSRSRERPPCHPPPCHLPLLPVATTNTALDGSR